MALLTLLMSGAPEEPAFADTDDAKQVAGLIEAIQHSLEHGEDVEVMSLGGFGPAYRNVSAEWINAAAARWLQGCEMHPDDLPQWVADTPSGEDYADEWRDASNGQTYDTWNAVTLGVGGR